MVDDRPFGGGDGMILKPEPIFAAVKRYRRLGAKRISPETRVVLLSAQGRVFSQALAQDLQNARRASCYLRTLRRRRRKVSEALATDEISIGDYVLSGGEPAAMVVIDAVVRLLPGRVGQ